LRAGEERQVLIDASNMHYRELNQRVRDAVAAGEKSFELVNVNGQRYIGDGIRGDDVSIDVHGVPGNDLGAFMDGPTLRVCGNAQDGVANTMNDGRIIVDGHAGDVLGYGMRGGELFVRRDVGYRVGIHMKAYRNRQPVVIAGGTAGDFLGEYMAGGILVILGLERRPGDPLVGDWCGTGMHGGAIFVRGELEPFRLAGKSVVPRPANGEDRQMLRPHVEAFSLAFGLDADQILQAEYTRIAAISHRPYGAKYAA
jgi:glutamate synthase domain-containing protein 3